MPRKEWTELAKRREQSFLKRHYLKVEDLSKGAKRLKPLNQGDHVYIQDQHGKTPTRWNKSGVVLECLNNDSYLVKVDGSNNVTKRNRQFLRHFVPFSKQKFNASQEKDLALLCNRSYRHKW